jgi:hypothetical protein
MIRTAAASLLAIFLLHPAGAHGGSSGEWGGYGGDHGHHPPYHDVQPTFHQPNEHPEENPRRDRSIARAIIFYVPNRAFDLLDIFRLRARVGPGVAAGVRVTRVADVYLGSYLSIYGGLPGPRRTPSVPMPLGVENFSAAGVSFLRVETGGRFSPNYSPTEIGFSLHPLLFGIDVGVDPVEVLDFLAGFLLIDIVGDDL